jgi:hypothetical protein
MAALKFKLIALSLLCLGVAAWGEVNHPPKLVLVGDQSVQVGSPLTFQVRGIDEDNNALTYSASELPDGASFDRAGNFSWAPTIGQLGIYPITVTVTDNGLPSQSDSETFRVKVYFRTKRLEKTWGLSLKEETLVDTTDLADLYPKVTRVEIDGQPSSPGQRELAASANPIIKIDLASPYNVDVRSLQAELDGASVPIASFFNIQSLGTDKDTLSLTIQLEPKELAFGDHNLVIRAGNNLGTTNQAIPFTVGGMRLVGTPLVFPSPYNPATGSSVIIQYTLTQAADVDLMIISSTGEILKKKQLYKGEEGGKPGLNKVAWDGRTELGMFAANGIYLATLVDRNERKVLGKAKLTVYK